MHAHKHGQILTLKSNVSKWSAGKSRQCDAASNVIPSVGLSPAYYRFPIRTDQNACHTIRGTNLAMNINETANPQIRMEQATAFPIEKKKKSKNRCRII